MKYKDDKPFDNYMQDIYDAKVEIAIIKWERWQIKYNIERKDNS